MDSDPCWSLQPNSFLYYEGQKYVPDCDQLWLRVLKAKHNYILVEYPGQNKIYQLIHHNFNWPKLWEFVNDYVSSYSVCFQNKARHHKPYGLLKQLPVPPQSWKSISMDFIEQLPPSGNYTNILVVVDRLTKQVVFIPTTRSINAATLAELFIVHIFLKHRVLLHITSNHGVEFVSKFFKSLAHGLEIKLHFTSGYYLEADNQTECTN